MSVHPIEIKLKKLTTEFALQIILLSKEMPKDMACSVIMKQLLRSATSVGANYSSSCRARPKADMISKLGIVEEEADESLFWLHLLVESRYLSATVATPLQTLADEILRIVVASKRTLREGVREEVAGYNPISTYNS